MKAYHIKLNGKYYVGENDSDASSPPITDNEGFYNINKNKYPELIFDEDKSKAKLLESWLNLKSDTDRILKREREKELSIQLLEIIYVEGE